MDAERMMTVSLVVAMATNRVIGRDGTLPWHLPADLRRFREITMGKPIVMGRRTHESIGRPLPGRRNIVLSRDMGFQTPGCEICDSLPAALRRLSPCAEVMVIGGVALYEAALPEARRIYLTRVHAEVAGDVRFPEIDAREWREIAHERHERDPKHEFDFAFCVLERLT